MGRESAVSRVLSRTIIHLRFASPRTCSNLPGNCAGHALFPYLVLLRVGFTVPLALPRARCALTAPFHPYRQLALLRRSTLCCTGRRLAPPRCYLALCPVEPGLSSPHSGATARARSDCLADSRRDDNTIIARRTTPPARPGSLILAQL